MIEVNNLTKSKINKKLFERIINSTLKKEKRDLDISVVIVGQEEIKALNNKYRKKNKPTDILSFLYDRHSGEIALCLEEVKQGKEIQTLIHGVLHLLGYDHEKGKKEAQKMRRKEEYYSWQNRK